MQMVLVMSEHETAAMEAAAVVAQAQFAGKSYWAQSCSFT
jgi:hypothetical protein